MLRRVRSDTTDETFWSSCWLASTGIVANRHRVFDCRIIDDRPQPGCACKSANPICNYAISHEFTRRLLESQAGSIPRWLLPRASTLVTHSGFLYRGLGDSEGVRLLTIATAARTDLLMRGPSSPLPANQALRRSFHLSDAVTLT